MDVHRTYSPMVNTWGPGLAYSRLFRFGTGDETRLPNAIVECDLCSSWRLMDPMTLEVKLREGVRWQSLPPVNGRLLTAEDVVFSYERQMTGGWPNAAVLANLSEVRAVGESVLSIRYRQPEAEFLEGLADGNSKIVSPEAVSQNGHLLRGPTVGTGPWMVVRSGSEGTYYEANPDYYEEGLPYLDGLDVQVVSEQEVAVVALRNGLLDLARAPYESVRDAKQAFAEIESAEYLDPGAGVELILNTGWAPFNFPDVRRGVLLALNPWTMSKDFRGGQSMPTLGLRVPEPDWLLPRDDFSGVFAKPSEARGLLAATAGQIVTISVGQFDPRLLEQARFAAESLRRAGMYTVVKEISTREYGDSVWVRGEYQAAIGALPPISSLTGGLLAVHHSRGGLNTTRHRIPELDDLIEKQAVELDPLRRREQTLAIQRLILSHAYRINLSAQVENWMWWDYVEGFALNSVRGENYFLAKVWFSRIPEAK